MKEIRVALCAFEGYGQVYVSPLLTEGKANGARLVGAIDPNTSPSPVKDLLHQHGVPLYRSLEDFYATNTCDLLILCSPIQFHAPQTLEALAHGSHVLCEKPLCATLDEARAMLEAERQSGKSVGIGYQWSYSPAIQGLKKDIRAGRYGSARRLRTIVLWPRSMDYYQRNNWAGRLKDDAGRWVLDSPANNAASHFLFNMLYVLGSQAGTSARVKSVEALRWRAFPITNFDTVALRAVTMEGVPLYFYSSHACPEHLGPVLSYEFEKGTVTYDWAGNSMVGVLQSGERIDYGSPEDMPMNKVWRAVYRARSGSAPLCGIAAAMTQTECIAMIHESPQPIRTAPKSRITLENGTYCLEGIEKEFVSCYEQGSLPPATLFDERT